MLIAGVKCLFVGPAELPRREAGTYQRSPRAAYVNRNQIAFVLSASYLTRQTLTAPLFLFLFRFSNLDSLVRRHPRRRRMAQNRRPVLLRRYIKFPLDTRENQA